MLTAWATRHAVTPAALYELRQLLIGADDAPTALDGASEAAVQSRIRVDASRAGWRLYRNNVGAGTVVESGSFLRWGLANDSSALNKRVKSGDLVGVRPVLIMQHDVGRVIGQFVSRECKSADWRYTGTAREVAQLEWIKIITALGGDASFTTGAL